MDKIICVGKNYEKHARELGDAVPEMPVLFLKPPSVLIAATREGETILVPLPRARGPVHHECEVVVRIGRGGSHMSAAEANAAIDAWTLGLDMTLRDVQSRLKKSGHPWEVSKVFTGSAIIAPWIEGKPDEALRRTNFSLVFDGKARQVGEIKDMRLSPAACVAYASEYFSLLPGDILFTGTPEGVGPVEVGVTGELRFGQRTLLRVNWVQ